MSDEFERVFQLVASIMVGDVENPRSALEVLTDWYDEWYAQPRKGEAHLRAVIKAAYEAGYAKGQADADAAYEAVPR